MTKPLVDSAAEKKGDRNTEFADEDIDSVEEFDGAPFEIEEEAVRPRSQKKSSEIRRKIEDLLERKRLREELGIYDEDALEGF